MQLDQAKIDALKAIKNTSLLINLIQENVEKSPKTALSLLNELGDNMEALGGIDLSTLESVRGEDGKSPVFGEDYMTADEIDGLERFIQENIETLEEELTTKLMTVLESAQDQINGAVAIIKNIKDGKDGRDGTNVTKEDIVEVFETYKEELKGSPDTPLEVVEKIKQVRGSKRLGFKNIRGLPELEQRVKDNTDDIDDVKKKIGQEIQIAVTNSGGGGGGGSTTFTGLTDTPGSYAGQAGLYAKVNVGETGLEFDTATGGGETNTGVNVGTGSDVFKQKTGVNLEFRTITAGSNVTVTENTNDIEIAASGGETNTGSNVGTGSDVFKQKTGVDLEFRTLVGGTNVTLTESATEITIDAAGGGAGTDLSIGTTTGTTVDINSSTGANATLPEATTTEAGLLVATDKVKLNNTSGTNTGDQDLSGKQDVLSEGPFVNGDKTKLDGIEALAEVNNISNADATDLTDGGDSTLHFHSADRARANHTGTQLASTISDFATTVTNNATVVANTAKVTNATHTGDVTGATALTVAPTAISGKTNASALTGAETVLLNQSGNLRKTTTQAIADLGGGGSFVGASAYNSASFTSTYNTEVKVPLNTEYYDIGSNFDTVNHRFIAPSNGYYRVSCTIAFNSTNSTSIYTLRLKKNAVTYQQVSSGGKSVTFKVVGLSIDLCLYLTGGQYLEMVTYTNQTGGSTVASGLSSTIFCVEKVG